MATTAAAGLEWEQYIVTSVSLIQVYESHKKGLFARVGSGTEHATPVNQESIFECQTC